MLRSGWKEVAVAGRERVLTMLKGGLPDRLPCVPISMVFAGDQLGIKYADYARDHRLLVEAQVRTGAAGACQRQFLRCYLPCGPNKKGRLSLSRRTGLEFKLSNPWA